ncbi:unnamed protein product [Allacma fusca]|uniref:Ceramide phosphoethanolamine synthase n=1 Tax=Allacma fusca TaxID=39272 RepID=A0A8J2NXD1_9HEXA|nr:unnamed protein product [Allacma fusca]
MRRVFKDLVIIVLTTLPLHLHNIKLFWGSNKISLPDESEESAGAYDSTSKNGKTHFVEDLSSLTSCMGLKIHLDLSRYISTQRYCHALPVGRFPTVFYFVSANSISVSHVLVAAVAAKLIAHDSLCVRRLGVVLFEVRNFLDAFDGTVARTRRSGQPSVSNSMGWYMDGICDGFGTLFLLLACFVYLRNHPIKKNTLYSPLPTTVISWTDQKDKEIVTSGTPCLGRIMFSFRNKACRSSHLPVWVGCQWLINSMGWNRAILNFASIFEAPVVSESSRFHQGEYLRRPFTIFAFMLWRLINVHAATEILLMSIFLDKLAECLVLMHFFGWALVGGAILTGEILVQNA